MLLLFRIVVDEDVVPAVPPFSNYHHFGSEVLIDGLRHSGSILINPSYVEKKFIQKPKSSVKAHLPGTYMKGLSYVKYTSEIFGSHQDLEYIVSFNNSSYHNSSSSNNNSKDNTNTNINKYNKSSTNSVLMVNEVNETTRASTTRASTTTRRHSINHATAVNHQISQQTSDMVVDRISLVVEFSKRNFNNDTNETKNNNYDDDDEDNMSNSSIILDALY